MKLNVAARSGTEWFPKKIPTKSGCCVLYLMKSAKASFYSYNIWVCVMILLRQNETVLSDISRTPRAELGGCPEPFGIGSVPNRLVREIELSDVILCEAENKKDTHLKRRQVRLVETEGGVDVINYRFIF